MTTKRERTKQRHEHVKELFKKLYDQKRLRFDDCVKEVAEQTHYSVLTVERIIKGK